MYRDIIPLQSAVESSDTFGNELVRRVSSFPDLFVKLVKGPEGSGGVVLICHLSDMREEHGIPEEFSGI